MKKYEYNKSVFKNINTEEEAYWLGFILADGCICYTMDKNYRRYQFSIVGTEQLMKKIYDIFLKETNIVLGYGKMKMIYRVYKKGNQQIMSILNWLYKDASVYLDRKHDKYEDMLNYYILKANTYSRNVLIEKVNILK